MPFVQVGTYPTRNFAQTFGWETYGFPLRCSPFPFMVSLSSASREASSTLGFLGDGPFETALTIARAVGGCVHVAMEIGLYLHPVHHRSLACSLYGVTWTSLGVVLVIPAKAGIQNFTDIA